MTEQYLLNVGVSVVILVALGYFVDRRIWPWFQKEYWPTKQKQTEQQTLVLVEIREAMVALKTIALGETQDRIQMLSSLNTISQTQAQMLVILQNLDRDIRPIADPTRPIIVPKDIAPSNPTA